MCTLLLALDVWPEARLVVAANRDELRDRPSAPPSVSGAPSGVRFVAPRDLRAGGTWLGLNERGVFVAITNRSIGGGPSFLGERRSRGELVLDALGASRAEEALDAAAAWPGDAHNPFHLAVIDGEHAGLVWSDGTHTHREVLAPGVIHVVTERSYGAAPSEREEYLRHALPELAAGPEPDIASWRALLSWRNPEGHGDDTYGGFEDMCVDVPAFGYGTVSASWVRMGPTAEVRFADGPPDTAAFEPVPLPWATPR